MTIEINNYYPALKTQWDEFVLTSKNGTFLFLRDYMDYHQHKFIDASLIIKKENKIVALLPAHKDEYNICSHKGLSYGGLITSTAMVLPLMLEVFFALAKYLKKEGYKKWFYKTIPYPYCQYPAEEDLYALFLIKATLIDRVPFSIWSPLGTPPFQKRRLRAIKLAKQQNLVVVCTQDYGAYWKILEDLLLQKFQSKPVHSLSEINALAQRFPEHIKLYACFEGQDMLAGVLVYQTEILIKFQYIAANEAGKKKAALDLIFMTLFQEIYPEKKYFDLGSSLLHNNELNVSLIEQKEGFGARTIVQDHYEVDLVNL